MFGWAKSPTFQDPDFGELTRKRGLWRGTVTLDDEGLIVPVAPDPRLALAWMAAAGIVPFAAFPVRR